MATYRYRITLDFETTEPLDDESMQELGFGVAEANVGYAALLQFGVPGINDDTVLAVHGNVEVEPSDWGRL